MSPGISKPHSSLNVPARKIQQKTQPQIQQQQHQQQHHEQQITQPFPGQQAILTDESGRLILSADDNDSMITLTGDDGMLYQVKILDRFKFIFVNLQLNIIFLNVKILYFRFPPHN